MGKPLLPAEKLAAVGADVRIRANRGLGCGLGLSLARTLAEGPGGIITATSPGGKKLVMSIRLN